MDAFQIKTSITGMKYLEVKAFENIEGVRACFSTRVGGVSQEEYKGLNMGVNTLDDEKKILRNYEIFGDSLNISLKNMVLSNQVHSDRIHRVERKDCGKGLMEVSDIIGVDALITNEKNIVMTTFHADCTPLYIYDPVNKAVGMVHSGWKGTALGIGAKTINAMEKSFGTKAKDCLVVIGPCIDQCCFEVGYDVFEIFDKKSIDFEGFFKKRADKKYLMDLKGINKMIVLYAGVPESQIYVSGLCTKCKEDLFYSYRREKLMTGRMIATIYLE